MATLDDIVRVDIALQTRAVARGEFGIPMIVGPLSTFAERVRVYNRYDDAVEDALPPTILAALNDCFAQTPRPSTVKVGRRQVLEFAVTASELIGLGDYSLTIAGTTYTFTALASPTAADIATGLKGEIDADMSAVVTATVAGDNLEIAFVDPDDAEIVTLDENLEFVSISPMSGATSVADDLTAINAEDGRWYGMCMVERGVAVIEDAAEWVETQEKLFVTASDQADILNPALDTDIISTLADTQYFRTAIFYHEQAATEYPDAALLGRVLTIQPGAETWALKTLASITPSSLTATERNTVLVKGGNTFEFYQPQLALTTPGKVAAGEWIDVIRFRDWLKDLIQTNMVQMMINRDKVPYTDAGIQLCVNNLKGSLRTGQRVGGIAPDELDINDKSVPGFIVTFPRSSEVDAADKAARLLRLGFVARLAGAIHMVDISGSLAYTLE